MTLPLLKLSSSRLTRPFSEPSASTRKRSNRGETRNGFIEKGITAPMVSVSHMAGENTRPISRCIKSRWRSKRVRSSMGLLSSGAPLSIS